MKLENNIHFSYASNNDIEGKTFKFNKRGVPNLECRN
jgi:hypothetical protein